jgi:hypothetical protein
MQFSLLYPSKYVKAEDLGGKEITKTIKAVRLEELEGVDGQKKTKVIVYFSDSAKMWVMPRTCGEALRVMFGKDTDQWVGKRVTLFSKKVDSFGEEVDAVRVRGSPDIAKPIKEVIPRGRKKIIVDVVPTKATTEPEPGSNG